MGGRICRDFLFLEKVNLALHYGNLQLDSPTHAPHPPGHAPAEAPAPLHPHPDKDIILY